MSKGAWITILLILGLCLADDIYYGLPPGPPQPPALLYGVVASGVVWGFDRWRRARRRG